MNADSSENTDPRWQKMPVANLVRHIQSGNYYARIRLRRKLIWKSLKTNGPHPCRQIALESLPGTETVDEPRAMANATIVATVLAAKLIRPNKGNPRPGLTQL